MRRGLVVAVNVAFLVVTTAAAAAVTRYRIVLCGWKGPHAGELAGSGSATYDDSESPPFLRARVTHGVAPVTTTVFLGAPGISTTWASHPDSTTMTMSGRSNDTAGDLAALASGQVYLFVGSTIYSDAGLTDAGVNLDASLSSTYRGQLVPDDGGVVADAGDPCALPPDDASASEDAPPPSPTTDVDATPQVPPPAATVPPGPSAGGCSVVGPQGEGLTFTAFMGMIISGLLYRRRSKGTCSSAHVC
jgi:hypothetical protein